MHYQIVTAQKVMNSLYVTDVHDDKLFSEKKRSYRTEIIRIFYLHLLTVSKVSGYALGQISATEMIEKI